MYKKIKVAYNNVFMKLCNVKGICSISQLFVFSNVDPFEVIVRKSKVSLRGRLMKSTNTIVAAVLSSSHFLYNSTLGKSWNSSVFNFTAVMVVNL